MASGSREFQSSPALSGRCNRARAGVGGRPPWRFQSSPALSGRCNALGMPLSLAQAVFQSSPALSGRCNHLLLLVHAPSKAFQSSPALSGRCNRVDGVRRDLVQRLVSILTGPFGPVQLPPIS